MNLYNLPHLVIPIEGGFSKRLILYKGEMHGQEQRIF
jgi:hypothetical protein